jgi:hypothetical protein
MNTATTSTVVGTPHIDEGKIQIEILVNSLGNPVPCGTAGATYVRFDGAGGGITPSGGLTATAVDLDNLESSTGGAVHNVHCGDRICIRAHYVTGGGATHVDAHFSDPTHTRSCARRLHGGSGILEESLSGQLARQRPEWWADAG